MAAKPCMECGVRPKWGGRHRCQVCHTRHLGVLERVEEAERRRSMIPEALHRSRVPERLWPAGQRWCAGCQSFVDKVDFGKGASQCKACVSRKSHAARVLKVYGIDAAEYARLLALQGGRCAICRRRPGKRRLAVDHDHKTGAVRGLACESCNHDLLGGARDTLAILKAAVNYLETPPTSGHWRAPETLDQAPAPDVPPIKSKTLIDMEGREVVPREFPNKKALVLAGGGKDERGLYRIYRPAKSNRPPF